MYYKLKTSFLEDTLGDVLCEDGFDILENSQGEFSFGSIENDSSQQTPSLLSLSSLIGPTSNDVPVLPSMTTITRATNNYNQTDGNDTHFTNSIDDTAVDVKISNTTDKPLEQHSSKEFEPIAHLDLNDRAWNNVTTTSVIGKGKEKEKKTTSTGPSLKPTLNTKLFSSTSFSKRNPRKSLSRTQSTKSLQSHSSQEFGSFTSSQELLPDLEAILLAKSQEKTSKETNLLLTSSSLSSDILDINSKTINRKIDNGWLNRCTSDNSIFMMSSNTSNILSNQMQTENESQSFGISNINLRKVENFKNVEETQEQHEISQILQNKTKNTIYDSDSVISNSEDESTSRICHFKHIRKKRRILETINKNVEKALDASQKELNEDSVEDKLKASKEYQSTNEGNKIDTKKSKIEKNEEEDNSEKSSRKSQRTKKLSRVTYKESNSPEPEKSTLKKSIQKKTKTVTTTRKSQRTKVPELKSKKSSSVEIKPNEEEQSNDRMEYNLDLGDGILNSLPRANIEEINQAAAVVQEYISDININSSSNKTEKSSSSSADATMEMKKKKLEMKIAAGKLNDNFVRIDIKKKIYARGKRNTNYSRYKKKMWKKKKEANALYGPDMDMGGCDGGIITCFTCGQPGHFAKNCKIKSDTLLPLNIAHDDDDSLYPSLKEAEEMAANQVKTVHNRNIENIPEASNELLYKNDDKNDMTISIQSTSHTSECDNKMKNENKVYIGHRIPEDFLIKCGLLDANESENRVQPLYSLNSDGSLQSIPNEVYEALHMFGHTTFRKGQDKAIMRILSGLSTLVTLSTGSGKSLCYQLPAFLYSRKKKCLTLVVSPLVSLMEDQVHGVPHFLRAHCLHTNQTAQQKERVLEMINNGECDVLLVSPEAIVSGEKSSSVFGSILNKLPPIAFACIDEAHCVSQWSHNFRPSYLMICKVLRERLKIHTILGLTATATKTTKESIIRHLEITDGENGIISDTPLPDNLILSVSKDLNRDAALVQLLKSER